MNELTRLALVGTANLPMEVACNDAVTALLPAGSREQRLLWQAGGEAVMATAGLYETSGDWLYEIGLPGKSGIGGGIVTVSPGKGGLGTFAPPLDAAGNSVKGQLVARHLSQRLGLDLFASQPAP